MSNHDRSNHDRRIMSENPGVYIAMKSAVKRKALNFLLSTINKLNRDFFRLQFFSLVCPHEKPLDIAFIPSVLEHMQIWWVSRIGSIDSGKDFLSFETSCFRTF